MTPRIALALLALSTLSCAGRPPDDVGEGEGEGEGKGEGEGEDEGEGEGEGELVATDAVPCALEDRIAFVRITESFGSRFLDARIDDDVPTGIGAPAINEPPCAHYTPSPCDPQPCADGEVCAYEGVCRAEAAPIEGATVEVTAGDAAPVSFEADEITGRIEGQLAVADTYELRVSIPGQPVIVFNAEMPVGFADFMTVEDEGDLENSGAVTATWESIGDGAQMHFFFKPNHHAPIGFSQCLVDETVETVTASAALIDPLRLVTGFEGGTVTRVFLGSAQIDIGCVELSVGTDTLIIPQ